MRLTLTTAVEVLDASRLGAPMQSWRALGVQATTHLAGKTR
jgi:hypothetical protein